MLSLFVSLSARLLGVRLSFFRALTASLLGFFTGMGLAALLIKQDYENASSALLFVLFPLLSTMAFIVLMELMARPGSRRCRRTRDASGSCTSRSTSTNHNVANGGTWCASQPVLHGVQPATACRCLHRASVSGATLDG